MTRRILILAALSLMLGTACEKQAKQAENTNKETQAKADPGKTDPGKTDPGKTDPAKTDPAKTDPAKTDKTATNDKVDPAKTDPVTPPVDGDKPPATAAVDRSAAIVDSFKKYGESGDLSIFAEDVKMTMVGGLNPPLNDRAALAALLDGQKKAFSDIAMTPVRVVELDETHALVEFMVTGTNDGSLESMGMPMPATNKTVGLTAAHVWTFNEAGLVTHADVYSPNMTMMVQLGLMPALDPRQAVPSAVPTEAAVMVKGPGKDANKAAAEKRLENWKANTMADNRALWAEPHTTGVSTGAKEETFDDMLKSSSMFRTALSDVSVEIKNTWVVGDYVVIAAVEKATHSGDIGPMKATNKTFTRPFLEVEQFNAEGKLVSHASYHDSMGVLAQLGLLPAAPGTETDEAPKADGAEVVAPDDEEPDDDAPEDEEPEDDAPEDEEPEDDAPEDDKKK